MALTSASGPLTREHAVRWVLQDDPEDLRFDLRCLNCRTTFARAIFTATATAVFQLDWIRRHLDRQREQAAELVAATICDGGNV